ncbi:MAG: SDR family oxidoreductase [Pseudomonadales bacterium]
MGRVSGKVIIVTGGGSGMGRADSIRLADEGAKIVVTDLNEASAKETAAIIGDAAIYMSHNVANESDWEAVIAKTVETFGRLDVLVNNAGVMKMGSVLDTTLEDWRFLHSVNNDGVFLGCKHAIPAMEASGGGGSIINMSSVAALHGMSFIAGYSASKGAVRALTKSVALLCKERNNGIRCNSIHPDGVKTPMVVKVFSGEDTATQAEVDAMGEAVPMAEPEEIAALVLYLASDESRFMNGSEVVIDNAATITPPVGV